MKVDAALQQQCETLRSESQQALEKRAAAENRAEQSAQLTNQQRTRIEQLEVMKSCEYTEYIYEYKFIW